MGHKLSSSKGQQWSDESESSHQLLSRHWRRRRCPSKSLPLSKRGRVKWAAWSESHWSYLAQSQSIADGCLQMGCLHQQWLCACVQERQQLTGGVKKKSIDRWKRVQFIPSKGDGSDAADTAAASNFGDREGEPSMRGFSHCDSGSLTANSTATQPVQPSRVTDRHRLEIRLANTSCLSKRKSERTLKSNRSAIGSSTGRSKIKQNGRGNCLMGSLWRKVVNSQQAQRRPHRNMAESSP